MIRAGELAADVSASTTAWFTLGGALGGVLITSVVGLATAMLNQRWQRRHARQDAEQKHHAQLRQERRECYVDYWAAWNRYHHRLRTLRREVAAPAPLGEEFTAQVWEDELEWRKAADAVGLIAGPGVVKALETHLAVTDLKHKAAREGRNHTDVDGVAYRGLNDAMRADLLEPVLG
jgi:hypothetical protein